MNRSGVRYITEEYIKTCSHEDRLERVRKLNLDCGNEDKPIRYIERMDNLNNLLILSIRFNAIEKIEKLDKLVNLQELYLSENKICKLDGLENLTRLRILDVRSNQINTIPHWFTRRCKYLGKINLSNNLIESIEEISKLSNLKDLIDLDVSENPVASIAHYRQYVIMRLKFLQIFDKREVTIEERRVANEQFEESEIDRLSKKLVENERQLEQFKQDQQKLQKDFSQQEQYQKDLHKKQKLNLDKIKELEENLKSKDSLLKKKSEDLFRACQKYYELEQDIAFIKIDAKFDLLSKNIGPLEEPDNVSDNSQISSTGDQAYMGKGQFITRKEATMLMEKRRERQNILNKDPNGNENCKPNSDFQDGVLDSFSDKVKEKLAELKQINDEIMEKSKIVNNLNNEIDIQKSHPIIPSFNESNRPRSALASINRLSPLKSLLLNPKRLSNNSLNSKLSDHDTITNQFLEKVENLTEMQKEAEYLRRQMESTEKETVRQQKDIEYLRNELKKLQLADPSLAHEIENEVKEKELHMDENFKIYDNLSKRLDQLSIDIENTMDDIKKLETKLLEDNQYFTEDLKDRINSILSQLKKSLPNQVHQDNKRIMDKYREIEFENEKLLQLVARQNDKLEAFQTHLRNDNKVYSGRSVRSIDDEVEVLRKELNQLRQDALAAKDDLESEIEMEKVLNNELQKQIDEMKKREENLLFDLELFQDKHGKIVGKMKADKILLQNSAEQQVMDLEDDLLRRIKMASDGHIENLQESKNPIDKALLHLMSSVAQKTPSHEDIISPSVNKINEDIKQIKTELNEVNRRISTDLSYDKLESSSHPVGNNNSNQDDINTFPLKQMLLNSGYKYRKEIQEIKARIQDLYDILLNGSQFKKKRRKSNRKFNLPNNMSDDISNDYTDSEEAYPIKNARARSQDRIPKISQKKSSNKKWKSLQQGLSSDEQAIFDTIQDELQDLIRKFEVAEEKNEKRIGNALKQINEMQRRVKNKSEDISSPNGNEYLDRDKEHLREYLRKTMSQVERCQDDIRLLNDRLQNKFRVQNENENTQFGSEVDRLGYILQNQKSEIERLNGLLEKMTSSGDSHVPQNPQNSVTIPFQPNQCFKSDGLSTFQQNSYSTPILNNNACISDITPQIKNSGSLFCNVPEHHYLEDFFQTNNSKHSWKMKRKFRSESNKYLNTLDIIQDDIHKKSEELDNIEIQISKQTNEIGRLNYQIEQLNFTKQDLLNNISSLRHETENITRERFDSTGESVDQMLSKKSFLANEVNKIDREIRNKKDELLYVDSELKKCNSYLTQIQDQTSETLKRHDEAKMNHRKVVLECEALEKKSTEASLDVAKAMSNLNMVQNEIATLSSNKTNLEDIVLKIQNLINQKDNDFQRLNADILKASKQLDSLHADLNMTTEKNREKMHMVSEGDRLLSDTRLELTRLKNEIMQNEDQLHKMESTIGERNAEINMVNSELERAKQLHHRMIQEHQNERTINKRELCDLKYELEDMKGEKNDLMALIENSKIKILQYKDNIDKQEQIKMIQQSELDKLNCQFQHIDNILKMKQSQLDKIESEYQNKIIELEKFEEDIRLQQVESKRLDSDIKRKSVEVDKLRQTIAVESENNQRINFDKENMELCIATLSKEKSLLQNEKKELEANVKTLKKQETLMQDSLLSIESKMSQTRTDLEKMHSEKCSETIKRDELKMQSNNLLKQLHESKCELQSIKERLTMIETQYDEQTCEIRKKMQLQASLNTEIRKLQDQLRLANMSLDEITVQEQQKKEKIFGMDGDISRKHDEIKNLEKKISDLKGSLLKEDNKLEQILKSSSNELEQIKLEISEKLENLEAAGNRLHKVKKDIVVKEFTEQKIFELEEIIKQQGNSIDQYEQENRKLSNHLSVLTRDLAILRKNNQFELENKDKEMAKLKKRLLKEIFQLEKLAEEQCSRANSLLDDLNQARRDYMLLRNRCLAQEHYIEQQNLFKEYMQPSYSKHTSVWDTNMKTDAVELPVNVEAAILTEHRRHLQNQLNLLKENIASATQDSQNGISQHKLNTVSSGLGSTLDHTGNSSDTFIENDRVKKTLHTQFNDDVQQMNDQHAKREILCRQLRSEVDHLKSSRLMDKSPSVSE